MKWYNKTKFINIRKNTLRNRFIEYIFGMIGDIIKCVTNLNILLGIIEISEFLLLNLLLVLLTSQFDDDDK